MKRSFLNQSRPVVTGIMAGQTPSELIAGAKHAEFDGAQGIAIELCDLKPEFRNEQSLKSIIDSVALPFMFCFYRNDRQQNLDDEERQKVLLAAADAGASMIDVMGDLYAPAPQEITHDAAAIARQKMLIEQIRSKGADVVMSSHTQQPMTTNEILEHMLELESRGPDVVKIVTAVNSEEELTEAFQTTMTLKRRLKVPFIHLCTGKFSRPHRFLGPALGTSILFAVHHFDPRYSMHQPTIRAMRAVLDNLHWNIEDVSE